VPEEELNTWLFRAPSSFREEREKRLPASSGLGGAGAPKSLAKHALNPSHVFHYFPLFNKDRSTLGPLTSAIRSLLDVEIHN
jgi:hypothetical protein